MHIKIIIKNKSLVFNILLCGFFIILQGCLSRTIVEKTDMGLHDFQNKKIERAILNKAKTGDWLVIRGYHATDNLVSNVTRLPISHVGVLDFDLGQVIEAEGQGVHVSTLSEFVNKSYRLLIIRPRWRNDSNAQKALDNGNKLVGKGYDFLGTVGFNYPSKYYCSELAVAIYEPWHGDREKFPTIITPGELYLYGKILYDSLPRDEM